MPFHIHDITVMHICTPNKTKKIWRNTQIIFATHDRSIDFKTVVGAVVASQEFFYLSPIE